MAQGPPEIYIYIYIYILRTLTRHRRTSMFFCVWVAQAICLVSVVILQRVAHEYVCDYRFFDTILCHFPCLKDVCGSFGPLGGHFGRSWDLSCGLAEITCEKWATYCFNMGGFGLRGAPLAALGCPLAESDCNNSAQKCPKDHLGGIVEIGIFLCVFL